MDAAPQPAQPSDEGRMGRFLMLTGSGLSLIVFGLALVVHNRLYSNDLQRANNLEQQVRERLDARPEAPLRLPSGHAKEGYEAALRHAPERAARSALDALLLYDETERSSFAALRWPGSSPDALPTAGLAAPEELAADYEAGAVSVRWRVADSTRAAARELTSDQVVRQRIYRTVKDAADPGQRPTTPTLLATVDLDTTRFRDADMPLAGGELSYEVWTVLSRRVVSGASSETGSETGSDLSSTDPETDPGAASEGLVRSESSELVTVPVPEHFRLMLLSGDGAQAVLRLEVGPASGPVGSYDLSVSPGDSIAAGDLVTGLTLDSLEVREEERLTTRKQLVFTSDARLVLDPTNDTPRTTETQVLMPVTSLVATLSDPNGEQRTLQLELK